MDNFELTNQLDRSRRELEILYELSNAMRTTLELNDILYIILTGVTAHTGLGFNRAILFLINQNERCLEPKMAIGPESGEHAQRIWEYITESKQDLEDLITKNHAIENNQSSLFNSIKNLKVPLNEQGDNLLISAYHLGTPVHIHPDKMDKYSHDPLLKTFKTKELIIMPLKAKDKVNGLIVADNLYTQKAITSEDLRMFTMLANQAGLAIENSQLYEMIKYKSHTDSLTNVWNHGFFQNQLSVELDYAKEKRTPLSLIMIDIDNFKKLNDTYGHQNGDIILKEVAKIILQSSRHNDYVCRYGGEEFSCILTGTTKEQGFIIAERMRQNIEKFDFSQSISQTGIKITVSIGLATFPEDTQTKEELINLADKAMYISKFSGKNQTSLAQKLHLNSGS